MKKILLLLIAIVATAACYGASGQWRTFNTFDSNIEKVADTPSATYFLCLGQSHIPSVSGLTTKKGFLFRYDKENDEFEELNASNDLSNTIVTSIDYNPYRGYLLAVEENGDIDLLYDNGEVTRIKALSMANVSGEKTIISVTFDPVRPYAYLATGFGTLTIEDTRGEVAASFNAGIPVNAFTRIGDFDIIANSDGVFSAPAGRPHFSMEDFTPCLEITDVTDFLSLDKNSCAIVYGPDGQWKVDFLDIDSDGVCTLTPAVTLSRKNITHNAEGHLFPLYDQFVQLRPNRTISRTALPQSHYGVMCSSWDGRELWFARPREGFYSYTRPASSGSAWSPGRGPVRPNTPAVMTSTGMTYHRNYGILANTRRIDVNFRNFNGHLQSLLSAWKDGAWEILAPAWTNPDRASVALGPNGVTVDIDNPKYLYMGSYESGIIRLNTEDPSDILHLTHPGDKDAKNPGYVKITETIDWFPQQCNYLQPKFDSYGNLWTLHAAGVGEVNKTYAELNLWTSDARKATTSASSFRPLTVIPLRGVEVSNFGLLVPLTSSKARNVIVMVPNIHTNGGNIGTDIYLYDHKGTFDNSGDDVTMRLSSFVDQDGNNLTFDYVIDLLEDQSTGMVWVATSTGVFTLDPLGQTSSTAHVNRIKVSRNDGTSLADYLLNDSRVNRIIDGGNDRKYFAVDGGIVVTSGDGRTIIREISTDNSDLPSDKVYDLCYNPDNNSLMVSTDSGLAEYYLTESSGSSETLSDVRIYPNPVRPDYYGYVTIDGLSDNALVKIVDSAGGIVKELGLAEGGEVKWDITNLNMKRVVSGVYYVMSSTGPDQDNKANVGKILVVN